MNKLRALSFYNDDKSLNRFLQNFFKASPECMPQVGSVNKFYSADHMDLICVKGLEHDLRGYRTDYISKQENLSWDNDWFELCDTSFVGLLTTQILPFLIQVLRYA